VGIPAPSLDSKCIDLLDDLEPGGVILFRRNIESADQVRQLTSKLREICGDPLHVCIDQEGGRVVRFHEGLTFFPGNMSLGSLAMSDLDSACELAWEQGWHTGRELFDLGIDVNLAPCVDLVASADSRGIGSRSFGSDPLLTTRLATALGHGMRESGVLDCWKHFPGLGRVTVDPHFGLPSTDAQGMATDLSPFAGAEAAGASMVMTSHVIARGLDPRQPVTTSPMAIQELRGPLGFSGAVMTDCLEMGGVSDLSPGDRAEQSLAAGHDILLVSHTAQIQKAIHQRMTEIVEREDSAHCVSIDRLNRLSKGFVEQTEPPQRSGVEVAQAICRGGVSLLQGELPPMHPSDRWILVLPEQFSHSPVEDPRPATELELFGEALPAVKETLRFDSPADLQKLALEWERKGEPARIILAIQGARLQPEFREALSRCGECSTALVILLLDDARDLGSMPPRESATVLCAHGARPLHLQTLAEVMRGETIPTGGQPI